MTAKDLPYIPLPNTMPRRALLALADAEGGALASVPLLEAIGQPPDYPSLVTIMSTALQYGLVERTADTPKKWAITDLGRETVDVIKNGASDLPQKAATAKPKPANEPMALDDDADLLPANGCEFALTSSGRLLIEAEGQLVALSKEAADALFAYTDEQRGVVWE